jgi:DNA repair exonuclease SbcCD ATPase subunit
MAEDTDKCPWCDSHISVSQSAEVREEFDQLVQELAAAKKRIQTLTEQLTTAKQEQRVLKSKADELTKPGKAARHHCPGCAAEIAESLINEIELGRNSLRKQVAVANASP